MAAAAGEVQGPDERAGRGLPGPAAGRRRAVRGLSCPGGRRSVRLSGPPVGATAPRAATALCVGSPLAVRWAGRQVHGWGVSRPPTPPGGQRVWGGGGLPPGCWEEVSGPYPLLSRFQKSRFFSFGAVGQKSQEIASSSHISRFICCFAGFPTIKCSK